MHRKCLVNGVVQSAVSAFDRGLLYGQSVFETVRVVAGRMPLLALHLARLERGAKVVGIPFDLDVIESEISQCLALSQSFSHNATLKILLTAGEGARGYRAPDPIRATRIIQCIAREFVPPARIQVKLCKSRLYPSAFAGLKHGNRLEQVVAARELERDDFDGLVADLQDQLVEATSANLLFVLDNQLITPAIQQCGVEGVMRAWLMAQNPELQCGSIALADLDRIQAMALINSSYGILPVHQLRFADGRSLMLESHSLFDLLKQQIDQLFESAE